MRTQEKRKMPDQMRLVVFACVSRKERKRNCVCKDQLELKKLKKSFSWKTAERRFSWLIKSYFLNVKSTLGLHYCVKSFSIEWMSDRRRGETDNGDNRKLVTLNQLKCLLSIFWFFLPCISHQNVTLTVFLLIRRPLKNSWPNENIFVVLIFSPLDLHLPWSRNSSAIFYSALWQLYNINDDIILSSSIHSGEKKCLCVATRHFLSVRDDGFFFFISFQAISVIRCGVFSPKATDWVRLSFATPVMVTKIPLITECLNYCN